MNKRTKIILVSGFGGILIGLFIPFGISILSNKTTFNLPRNCGEYVKTFYDMGGRYYGAVLDQKLIEIANQIQQICNEKFPQDYTNLQSNRISEVKPFINCVPLAILATLTGIPECNEEGVRTKRVKR